MPQSLWNEVRDRAVAMMKEHQGRRRPRLPQLHGRGHRQEGVRRRSASTSTTRRRTRRCSRAAAPRARRATSSSRRWCETEGSRLPAAVRGDLRAGADRLRLSRREVGGDARHRRPDVALRADRRGVRARPRRDPPGGVARCATRPATSTSTTSRPARSSGSSRSAARAASGTNDKAGSKLNLVRWASARTVKETLAPPRDYKYPFMAEE